MSHIPIAFYLLGALLTLYAVAVRWKARNNRPRLGRGGGGAKPHAPNDEWRGVQWARTLRRRKRYS